MANGTTPVAVPAWIQTVSGLVTTVGVPTVVAGVLLWFMLTRVDTALRQIQAEEDRRTQFVAAMQKDLIETLTDQTTRFEAAIEKNAQVVERNVRANEDQTRLLTQLLATRKGPPHD
jgi:hypothetical protein